MRSSNPFSREEIKECFELKLFGFTNVDCVRTLRTFADFELYGVSIVDFTSHLGLVYEEIFSAFLFDEAEALYLIKPLYCTCWHYSFVRFHLNIVSDLILKNTLTFALNRKRGVLNER